MRLAGPKAQTSRFEKFQGASKRSCSRQNSQNPSKFDSNDECVTAELIRTYVDLVCLTTA